MARAQAKASSQGPRKLKTDLADRSVRRMRPVQRMPYDVRASNEVLTAARATSVRNHQIIWRETTLSGLMILNAKGLSATPRPASNIRAASAVRRSTKTVAAASALL